ncbi:MAG: cytochrome c biogenesis CcdA family protein [Rhodospirillales bacterium]
MIRKLFHSLVATILLLLVSAPAAATERDTSLETTHIFFSAGCADCWPYTQEVLVPALQARGRALDPRIHDYTAPGGRKLLLEEADSVELPRSIADSLYAFVPMGRGTLVVLGHVPKNLIDAALTSPDLPPRLVIWQPEMHGEPTEYRLWAWTGEVKTFPIDTPFDDALTQALAASGPLPVGQANLGQLLPTVIVTGLLDSVNPCAFAVILLLIAFLFTLRRSRARILQLGSVYIGMIFLVYFAIGLGILRSVRLSDDPHFVAQAGSWLLIGLGVINLIEYYFPRFPIKLHMPAFAGARTNQLIRQATLPATVAAGILVGLCTFPCSGGIYVAVITLLNVKTTMAWGVGYLALYNVMFVLPLIAIVLAAGNRVTAKAWAQWEREHAIEIRLWYGIVMVGLGAIMLLWVIN